MELAKSYVSSYYPSLNGLRGIAILAVFLRHYGILVLPWPWLYALWSGVDLFFVISGFLITGILFDTLQKPRYFYTFYVRRTLRIFPVYYAIFALILLARLTIPGFFFNRYMILFPAYIANLVQPFLDLTKHNPTVFVFTMRHRLIECSIGPFWSLCVEEQFYLLWPLVVFLVRSRERLMRVALVGLIAVNVIRIVLYLTLSTRTMEQAAIYILTFTRCDGLLVGAWCALWLRGVRLTRAELRRACYGVAVTSCLLIALALKLTLRRWPSKLTNPFFGSIGYTLIAFAFAAALLLSLDEDSWLSRISRVRWISSLGVISYGFYLIHDLPDIYTRNYLEHHQLSFAVRLGIPAAVFAISYGIAWASFHYFETPISLLKDRWAPSRPAALRSSR